MNAATKTAEVIPCLRYEDAPAAIDWLVTVFGFEKNLVVPGEGNSIAHAQLTFGTGMVMLSSVGDDPFGKSPRTLGGVNQTISMSSSMRSTHTTAASRPPAPRSCATSGTRTTADAAIRFAIPKAMSGRSAAIGRERQDHALTTGDAWRGESKRNRRAASFGLRIENTGFSGLSY